MHVIYTTRTSGFERGKHYRNPEHFGRIEPRAEVVTVEGSYPAVVAAYEAADIEVEVIGVEQSPANDDEQQRRAELMDAIEQATGKRPGVNTKTETLEKQYAELTKNQE